MYPLLQVSYIYNIFQSRSNSYRVKINFWKVIIDKYFWVSSEKQGGAERKGGREEEKVRKLKRLNVDEPRLSTSGESATVSRSTI